MDLNQYQELALKTAIYPGQKSFAGLIYTTLKLNGEAGEIAEKVGKVLRDAGGVLLPGTREELRKELGDVLWYVAAMASELGVDLDFIAKLNIQKLTSRAERNMLGGSGDNR